MAKSKKLPKVIYFTKGVMATDDERKEADKIDANVVFRNASLIADDGMIEDYDNLAGAIPEAYEKHFAENKDEKQVKAKAAPKSKSSAPAAPQKAAKPSGNANQGGAWQKNT